VRKSPDWKGRKQRHSSQCQVQKSKGRVTIFTEGTYIYIFPTLE
jgi:hypothetical protein